MKKILIVYISMLVLFSCNPSQSVDSPELREEVENRKIKQIHEPEILARALKIGREIQSKIDSNINLSLIETKFNVKIRKVMFELENNNEIENQLLDAYLYNEENKIESTENIQKLGKEYIYVTPVFVNDSLIGMWSIVLQKKNVVLSISDDTWKHKKLRNPRTQD